MNNSIDPSSIVVPVALSTVVPELPEDPHPLELEEPTTASIKTVQHRQAPTYGRVGRRRPHPSVSASKHVALATPTPLSTKRLNTKGVNAEWVGSVTAFFFAGFAGGFAACAILLTSSWVL